MKNRKTIELIKESLPSFENLARAFYEVDPMNTCCVPNGNIEEYFIEARATLENMQHGLSLHDAITASLIFFFEIDEERAYRHAVEIADQVYMRRMQIS